MALELSIKACLDSACDTLTLYELTGIYDASTNPTGYGAPNPETGDVDTTATLVVTSPDEVEYTIDLTGEFPRDNDEDGYEIDLASLGSRDSIEDGYWTFTYTISGSGTYTVTQGHVYTCNARCCVAKLLAKVEPDECDCNDQNIKRIDNYTKARTFLDSLENAANCFNMDKFDKINTILLKLCRNADCKTCN